MRFLVGMQHFRQQQGIQHRLGKTNTRPGFLQLQKAQIKRGVMTHQHSVSAILMEPVSYTHLDVYKRQLQDKTGAAPVKGHDGGMTPGWCANPAAGSRASGKPASLSREWELWPVAASGSLPPVSYTHLDVYKRQVLDFCCFSIFSDLVLIVNCSFTFINDCCWGDLVGNTVTFPVLTLTKEVVS